jgi:hypothetical protein
LAITGTDGKIASIILDNFSAALRLKYGETTSVKSEGTEEI